MTNPILEKNLECIKRYNPGLVDELLKIGELNNNFELIETLYKEPNLSYNGLPLHSQEGAEREARSIFNSVQNSPVSMHVVFGFGLGHLFKEFCENSKGLVIVFEPNLEILRVTLEIVDFSKELAQSNVIIVSDMESFKAFFMHRYIYKADSTFIFLNSYKELYSSTINETFQQIEIITGICMSEYNTMKSVSTKSINTILENLPYTFDETPLFELKDVFKGKTALIVSAGPSLDNNIEIIKQNRDKVVIFCVGTALRALVNNGIIPDFLNMIEIHDCSGQVDGIDLSEINLILEPYTNNAFHKIQAKQKFAFATNSAHANGCWSMLTGVDISPYTARGTVSYEAIFSAKILGFKKIILVGQDLAYVNNQCYSKGAAYSELAYQTNPETNQIEFVIKDEERYVKSLIPDAVNGQEEEYKLFAQYKLQNLNSTLYFVKGITGEMLPTQGGYATFIEHFREFASIFKDLDLINSSMVGAQIDGFKNIPLEEALKDAPVLEKVDLTQSFKYDKDKVLKNLEAEHLKLEKIMAKFMTAKDYMYKYEREFNRRKCVTGEAVKYFKLLLTLYSSIASEDQPNSPMYHAISFSEDIEVQYLIKKCEDIDLEGIHYVYTYLKQYFVTIENRIWDLINIIKNKKEIIVESINSAC